MRVAIVEPVGKGGLMHYAFQLARALADTGAEVALFTDRNHELASLERPFELRGIFRLWDPKPAVDSSPGWRRAARRVARGFRYAGAWLRLRRELVRWRPDWVQLGDLRFAGDLLGVLLLRSAGLRLADVCHNVEPYSHASGDGGSFRSSAWTRLVWRATYRRMERIFVHEESNRQRFLDLYGLPEERITAIPHGDETIFEELADPSFGPADLRRQLSISETGPVVLFFGTLAAYKGIDLLIEAFSRLDAGRVDAQLVIAGYATPGFDVRALRRTVHELGISDRTRIVPGYVASEHVAAWMRLASIAVFPYRSISQSGALQVAATMGVPVVASAVGALAEVVRDRETGRLVDAGSSEQLAAAIRELLERPRWARELGERMARQVRERASWPLVASRILTAYGSGGPSEDSR